MAINKRKMSMRKYGISQQRYNELTAFCKQYPEWIEELENLEPTVKAKSIDGMPYSHTNVTGDPTASMSIKRVELQKKIQLIEETAKEACPEFHNYIIRNICFGDTAPYLITVVGLPISIASFTDRKKYFYHLLDKKKE